ncbi:patatin-like phospholipase family protein [Iodobacter sp. HSC-16F04]|uniref:Patatin-like phospholipase family protein n=1 Tax=Iodobacter violaceini TaxID=3044271 RepID=A0ABX0KQ44_9NEIS|nr:patatin-like phospholipase family protein [Iodobacter violacea]NHQ86678.1 patatin-like phospholipase family protein [Iodobacter violacea]
MAAASKKSTKSPKVVLVLQGGGALGAYHIGAYAAMQEAGFEPDWVTGISIGAINAAVIASNPPDQRIEKLETLWESISRPDGWGSFLSGKSLWAFNQFNVAEAMLLGQPNFWLPRLPSPLLLPSLPTDQASFCDTTPMLSTLRDLASFENLNAGKTARLTLGATKVDTGELVFFDSATQKIEAEHVLASGSLPPGFAATKIGDEYFWDGGCVSNTPLNAVLDDKGEDDLLVFMVDLWSAEGPLPTSMDAVAWRQKEIQYASRNTQVEAACTTHNLRRALAQASPDTQAVGKESAIDVPQRHIDIVHITYTPSAEEGSCSDAEFSRPSIARRRAAGYADMQEALAQSPWKKQERAANIATTLHRLQAGKLDTQVCL